MYSFLKCVIYLFGNIQFLSIERNICSKSNFPVDNLNYSLTNMLSLVNFIVRLNFTLLRFRNYDCFNANCNFPQISYFFSFFTSFWTSFIRLDYIREESIWRKNFCEQFKGWCVSDCRKISREISSLFGKLLFTKHVTLKNFPWKLGCPKNRNMPNRFKPVSYWLYCGAVRFGLRFRFQC